jgi:hypothetical protein
VYFETSRKKTPLIEYWFKFFKEYFMKRSMALLISAIIGLIYGIFLIIIFFTGNIVNSGYMANSSPVLEALTGGIVIVLVLPHMICVLVAVIFNILGWVVNKREFALTAGILYSASAVMFIVFAVFVVPSIVLSFVGYVKLKEIIEQNEMKTAAV